MNQQRYEKAGQSGCGCAVHSVLLSMTVGLWGRIELH
jgi:hypothetical protein